MKSLVISGINLFEGGPLSIYYDCLDAIIDSGKYKKYNITIFVHKSSLFDRYKDYFRIIELPNSRKNYLFRLYYEYIFFSSYSHKHNIDVWLSLHDITPRVKAQRIYTYCHNPAPFMKKDIRKIVYNSKYIAFSFFYKYLYKINIHSADALIVQQDWIRKEFYNFYNVDKIIVSRPRFIIENNRDSINKNTNNFVFFFPAYPRFFKNFEVILDACRLMNFDGYEVWITADGTENRYTKSLKRKYGFLESVKWLGLLSRDDTYNAYSQSDCLIFPSKLETWGLPISEYKITEKPMLLSNMPYAHETLGSYRKVCFFNPDDPEQLSDYMKKIINGTIVYDGNIEVVPDAPYCKDWDELIKKILN